MNVLNINLPNCHFRSLIELVRSGHNVYTTHIIGNKSNYESKFGIQNIREEQNSAVMSYTESDIPELEEHSRFRVVDCVERMIEEYDIDILQVAPPNMAFLHTHFADKLTYIGVPETVSLHEGNKLHGKEAAESLGLNVPRIIKRGNLNASDFLDDLDIPAVIKPSAAWAAAMVIHTEDDVRVMKNNIKSGAWDSSEPQDYYVEEYLQDMIETNIFFAVANGEYAITHTQQIIGEDKNKRPIQSVWFDDTYMKPLDPEIDAIVRDEVQPYLQHLADLGGRWEGSLCGAYTSEGQWYFLETNVRPDVFNSNPTFMSGDDYIKGMIEDVSLFGAAWKDINISKLFIHCDDISTPYPIHLHDKYDVLYPNNLHFIGDDYFVIDLQGFVESSFQNEKTFVRSGGTFVIDNNVPAEFIREVEESTSWKFNADPDL